MSGPGPDFRCAWASTNGPTYGPAARAALAPASAVAIAAPNNCPARRRLSRRGRHMPGIDLYWLLAVDDEVVRHVRPPTVEGVPDIPLPWLPIGVVGDVVDVVEVLGEAT